MRYFCSFTSGSKGNSAIYVSPGAKILIDAGSSAKYITSCLSKLGLCPGDLTHIVLTHAHSDHISALPVLSKYTDARLVCSEDTYDQLPFAKGEPLLFAEGDSFELNDVAVQTAPTPHDCDGSCCYLFGEDENSLGFCTDMGRVTERIYGLMKKASTLFIESNHDVDMLANGPYPYYLKQRILSFDGHLSNADCAYSVSRLVEDGVRRVMLGHLSETNNRPDIALSESKKALEQIGADAGHIILGAAGVRDMRAPVIL